MTHYQCLNWLYVEEARIVQDSYCYHLKCLYELYVPVQITTISISIYILVLHSTWITTSLSFPVTMFSFPTCRVKDANVLLYTKKAVSTTLDTAAKK